MEREAQLRLCDANLCEFFRELTRRSPGGVVAEDHGVLLFAGPHPSPVLVNGAMRTDPSLSAEDALRRAAAFFKARGRRFTFWVLGDDGVDFDRAAREVGFELVTEVPQMVLDRRLPDRQRPEGVTLRRVDGARGLADFVTVVAEAFEDEAEFEGMVRSAFVKPRSLVAPHIAGFVAYVDETPASASMTLVSHGVACINWVATRPFARWRGLGDLVTRAATNAGFDLGARFASLQASPSGVPVYTKLGYREISRYRWYSPAP